MDFPFTLGSAEQISYSGVMEAHVTDCCLRWLK